MAEAAFLAVLIAIGIFLWRSRQRRDFGIPQLAGAKLLYIDKRSMKSFISREHGIVAKPDFIVRSSSGDAVVEYKSRYRGIYPSDRVQTIASVIAARSTYPGITKAYVINASGEHAEIDCNKATEELYEQIKEHAAMARRAKYDNKAHFIRGPRCRSCSVKPLCKYA